MFDPIIVGLEAYEESVAFPLRNEYLVTGELTNNSGGAVEKQFLLRNDADDLWFNMASDENGSFASYVPAGDWVAIVAPYIADNDSTETLRYPFTVGADSSVRNNLTMATFDVVELNFQLQESDTETNMSILHIRR